jgi:hypothetical protein
VYSADKPESGGKRRVVRHSGDGFDFAMRFCVAK